jgi:hypothetical protein
MIRIWVWKFCPIRDTFIDASRNDIFEATATLTRERTLFCEFPKPVQRAAIAQIESAIGSTAGVALARRVLAVESSTTTFR